MGNTRGYWMGAHRTAFEPNNESDSQVAKPFYYRLDHAPIDVLSVALTPIWRIASTRGVVKGFPFRLEKARNEA
jgi:hypothetical protein